MIRAFIVEDSEERKDVFQDIIENKFGGECIFNDDIETVEWDYISNFKDGYDFVMFDHDLGDKDSPKNNGYTIAMRLREAFGLDGFDEEIIIHSSNPVGADKIKKVFSQSTKNPFYTLAKWVLEERIRQH